MSIVQISKALEISISSNLRTDDFRNEFEKLSPVYHAHSLYSLKAFLFMASLITPIFSKQLGTSSSGKFPCFIIKMSGCVWVNLLGETWVMAKPDFEIQIL